MDEPATVGTTTPTIRSFFGYGLFWLVTEIEPER